MAHPERITALVSQNGNAYDEGLGGAWATIQRYWREPRPENREAVRRELTPEGIRSQYTYGVPHPEVVAPEGYTLDVAMTARPGNMDIQLDLFLDYASNVKLYPAFRGVLPQGEAATARDLGQARSLLHSSRCRGLSTGQSQCARSISGHGALRHRNARGRDRGGNEAITRGDGNVIL
jgi:hypothetical protein